MSVSSSISLQHSVEQVLQLVGEDAGLGAIDLSMVRESLRKATAPTFEIVFAGAFSAGKSIQITAEFISDEPEQTQIDRPTESSLDDFRETL